MSRIHRVRRVEIFADLVHRTFSEDINLRDEGEGMGVEPGRTCRARHLDDLLVEASRFDVVGLYEVDVGADIHEFQIPVRSLHAIGNQEILAMRTEIESPREIA